MNGERHHRDPRERRQTHPSPEDVKEALDALLDADATSTPPLSALRTLEAADITAPVSVGDRIVREWGITRGDPQHGALKSHDHVSYYEVEFHQPCSECRSQSAVWEYSAHHNIAGFHRTYCPACETVHDREEWG